MALTKMTAADTDEQGAPHLTAVRPDGPDAPGVADVPQTPMLTEVAAGLAREQKELPTKYFYDHHGSELFERITTLPEYYPTRTERAVLENVAPAWVGALRPRALVELGAGSAIKTRVLLDAMLAVRERAVFVPVDVSGDFLAQTAIALRAEYPALDVRPAVSDFTRELHVPDDLPAPAVWAFLGSTIGNFTPDAAAALLRRVADRMRPGDRFLLGADQRKSIPTVEAAYNDSEGVTAAFNRNILRVVNRELGSDFRVDAFHHRAFYDGARHRIEMHLVAGSEQTVRVPGAGTYHFRAGETIRTEISCKYDQPSVAALFASAGLQIANWATDQRGWFALALGELADD